MKASLSNPPGFKRGDALPHKGYGRCYGCHLPWYAADELVSVRYASNSSRAGIAQFALGRGCWHLSTIEQRVAAHQWVCDVWEQQQRYDGDYTDGLPLNTVRARVEAAIHADDISRAWCS